jgi:hypothetical protein|tara:strand:- start:3139 stop:3891 length:753 start_codon:yes stop_codon:yes gene_type:complete
MAVTTSAVIGIGSGIATSIKGFTDAGSARTAQQNADNEAKRMMMNARKRAEQNEYGELSLGLESFEAEFEANLAADRQAIEALQEGDSRSLAAGVGRVGAQQNQEAQATRMNMSDEMFGLEKMKADAKEQQKQQLISMDVGEAKMQDQKSREAAEQRRRGIEAGFQGIGQVAQGVGDMAPLYGRSMNDKRAQGLVGNNKFLEGMGIDPSNLNYEQRMALMDKISGVEITGQQYRQGVRDDFKDFDFSIFN